MNGEATRAFVRDVEGKISAALVALGWTPPSRHATGRDAVANVSEAIRGLLYLDATGALTDPLGDAARVCLEAALGRITELEGQAAP